MRNHYSPSFEIWFKIRKAFIFTRIVCDRLFVMQELSKSHRIPYSWQRIPLPPIPKWSFSWMDFEWNFTKNNPAPELKLLMEDLETSVWAFQEYLPRELELLMEDWGTLVLSLPRIASPPELKLHMEDLWTSVLSLPRIPHPHTPFWNWNFSWRAIQGTGAGRLILYPLRIPSFFQNLRH